jgi:hypothetical protein
MKKILMPVAIIAAFAFLLSSCEQETLPVEAPQTPAVKEMNFTTTIRVPLTEGRVVTGEASILNPSRMKSENIEKLAPAFAGIWKDAIAGRYDTYPIEEKFPTGVTEKNFLASVTKTMAESGFELNEAGMLGALEIGFSGKARQGSSEMQAEWLRFVWTDPKEVYPDRNICQIRIADLKDYTVQTNDGAIPFVTYLNARNYDGYPINVGTDRGMARMKSYDEARKVEVLTAQGELDQLTYYPAN